MVGRAAFVPGTHGLPIGWRMTEATGDSPQVIVQRYRERFGRGPTVAKAHVGRDFAVVVLGDVQTEVERSLVAEGEVESVELLRRRIRQMATDGFCAATEDILGRKVQAMLGDHNARANSSVMVFLLEPERP
jgi:uncharacterized protein YbcI